MNKLVRYITKIPDEKIRRNYCPNCGVIMKGRTCPECGYEAPTPTPKPIEQVSACPKCGYILHKGYCEHCEEYVTNPIWVDKLF